MSRSLYLIIAWGLSIFISITAFAAMRQESHVPQAQPFNVYTSGLYCVYVASNQAGIAMQVMVNPSATEAMLGGTLRPCE